MRLAQRSGGVLFALLLSLIPALAQAEIGRVSLITGEALRHPSDEQGNLKGEGEALALGSPIMGRDTVVVGKGANLKITLLDGSVVKLGEGSRFFFKEAAFDDQNVRQSFFGSLEVGKFWAKVKKAVAGSDQKFKVSAGRAVAGVRGTIFRVDATAVVARAAKPTVKMAKPKVVAMVRVTEGLVGVEAQLPKPAQPAAKPVKGKRVQVAGPQEISAEAWEKKFAELQKGMQVTVSDDSFETSTFEPSLKDAFDQFTSEE